MDQQQQRAPRILALVMSAAYAAAVTWAVLPHHQRQQARMGAARTLQRLSGQCARGAGEASMGAELRTGHRLYAAPYLLSRVRDAAGAWYERCRP